MSIKLFIIKLILVIMTNSINCIPINNSSSLLNFNQSHRSLTKRALSYIANDTVCIIDNLIYQNGDPIPTGDDPCELCKCRPPGFACALIECEVKPGCKEIQIEGECCPTYKCGCEVDGKFYKDGEFVPNPNKLLNCYRCKCRGSSIICGLMDCQYRLDCEPRYEDGNCCPTYDHCDKQPPTTATTSTTPESLINRTQFIDIATSTSVPELNNLKTTTFKSSTILIDVFSPDQEKKTENSTPHSASENSLKPIKPLSSINNDQQQQTTTLSSSSIFIKSNTDTLPSKTTTISPNENDDSLDNNELNKVKSISNDKQFANNLVESNDVKVFNNVTSVNDDNKVVSNNNLIKITQSTSSEISITSNKIESKPFNQIEIDRRNDIGKINDENLIDKKLDNNKNEILEENYLSPSTILPLTEKTNIIDNSKIDDIDKELNKDNNEDNIGEDKIQSSTTLPNITDTTILAPNTSSIVNFITQSPINEIKDTIVDKKIEDLDELIKNDSTIDTINKDEINSEIKTDEIKTDEIKADEIKIDEIKIDEEKSENNDKLNIKINMNIDEELKTPLKLLKKVLDNCSNYRCNTMEKLIKVTENVLSELDDKVIEKIKLSEAFEHLKIKLIGNSDIDKLATERPFFNNSTESGVIEFEEYPTTIRYLRTEELTKEHKNMVDDLELESDEDNKAYGLI